MKKLIIGLLVSMAFIPVAMADQLQVGYLGSGNGPYQAGAGGEFTLNPLGGWLNLNGYVSNYTRNIGVNGTFQSFCLEGNEYLYPYPATYDAVMNNYAVNGGMGGDIGPYGDPISVGTGWLYSQFASTVWDAGLSYNYDSGRTTSADALQKAIWWLEGEEGIGYNASNPYMLAAVNKFGGEAGAMAPGGYTYNVYALNISDGGPAQDQLFYGTSTTVPEPNLNIMLGIGLLTVITLAVWCKKI